MIVEIEEFNQVPPKDNSKEDTALEKAVTRVLLRPNSETLFADLCLLNQKAGGKWTDKDALEVEAKILVRSLLWLPPQCALCAHSHVLSFRSLLRPHLSAWTQTPASERLRTVSIVYLYPGHPLHYDQRNARQRA